jgi:hypothetical protein
LASLTSRCDALNIAKVPVDLRDAGDFVELTFHVDFDSPLTFQGATPGEAIGHGLFTAVPDNSGIRVKVRPEAKSSQSGTVGVLTFLFSQPASSTALPLHVTQVSIILQSGGAIAGEGVDGSLTPQCKQDTSLPPRPAFLLQHLAGSVDGPGGRDGIGRDARFGYAFGIANDPNGTLVIADEGNFTIRRMTLAGNVTTIAGTAGVSGTTDSTGSSARFIAPHDVSVDRNGNIYVLDGDGFLTPARVRRVSPGGGVTTVMGAGTDCSSEGVSAVLGFCDEVIALAAAPSGDIYLLERARIRRIGTDGRVAVIAGSDTPGFRDGVGAAAAFDFQNGSATFGPDGYLYVYDGGNRAVRAVAPDGTTTTLVAGDPFLTTVYATGIAITPDGTIFVRQPNVIFKVHGHTAIVALSNVTWIESRMAITNSGSFIVSIGIGTEIANIDPSGQLTIIAGHAAEGGHIDGAGASARFSGIYGMTLNGHDGRLYVSDGYPTADCSIRAISPDGTVSTIDTYPFAVCATDMVALSDGSLVLLDGWASPNVVTHISLTGVLLSRRPLDTSFCYDLAVDQHDNVFTPCLDGIRELAGDAAPRKISSFSAVKLLPLTNGEFIAEYAYALYRLKPDGSFALLAGTARALPSQADGSRTDASFGFVSGMVFAPDGGLFVVDTGDSLSLLLRHVSMDGSVTTLTGGGLGTEDGLPGTARLAYANKIAIDKVGNIYISDGAAIRVANWTSMGRGRSVRH